MGPGAGHFANRQPARGACDPEVTVDLCPASGVAWGMGAGTEPLGFLCPAELLPWVGHGATFIPAVFAEPLAQPLLLGSVWEPVCLRKPGLVESTFTVS